MTDPRQFLIKLNENLAILQEREAKYGGSAPLALLAQIRDHRQAITLTEQARQGRLSESGWREALRPLLVDIRDRSEQQPESCGVSIGDVTGGITGSVIAGGDVWNVQEARGSDIAQAGPGGHAEVNRSVFDMRGQTVGRQYNIQGDYIQSREGDTINMSGDFRGALVNVKSTLDNVTQTLNAAPNLKASLKAELAGLVAQLGRELAQTPPARAEEAEAVAETARQLVELATAEKPNRTMVQITGDGLKQAAQNIAEVLPTVLVIATRIVGAISGSGG